MLDVIMPDWSAPLSVRAFTTTRRGPGISQPPFDSFNLGNRCGDDPVAVAANRIRLKQELGLIQVPIWLRQVHGVDVYKIDTPLLVAEPEADAAITDVPNQICAVLTADCLPLLVCAADGTEVAAIHAGWRGLLAGVIESCITRMRTPVQQLLTWLGPAIGPKIYEVGDEVRDAFLANTPAAAEAFQFSRSGHWYCNLYQLARQRLSLLGIDKIHGGDLCTFSDPQRFYSHRRDGRSGRMASLIWIK